MSIKGVANIWMPVQDIERAVDFYNNTLGLRVINRDGPWAEVDANGITVGLNGREPEGTQAGGGPVLTFQHDAFGGNDAVNALAEDDTVYGGLGTDTIYGGAGDDVLLGEQGNDVIVDVATDDIVAGGPGNDRISVQDGDHDDVVNCGGGKRDSVVADRRDFVAANCERR